MLHSPDLTPLRAFHRRIGGTALPEWEPWPIAGEALRALATADLDAATRKSYGVEPSEVLEWVGVYDDDGR